MGPSTSFTSLPRIGEITLRYAHVSTVCGLWVTQKLLLSSRYSLQIYFLSRALEACSLTVFLLGGYRLICAVVDFHLGEEMFLK